MGRATLILVVLMSTLFAGVAMRMNRNMLELPELLTDNQIKREAENISDYSLRYAINQGSDAVRSWYERGFTNAHVYFYGSDTEQIPVEYPSENGVDLEIHTHAFPLGNGRIKQISFKNIHLSEDGEVSFRAVSTVQQSLHRTDGPEGLLQNRSYEYVAEVAFNTTNLVNPNCFYHEMNDNFNGNSIKKKPVADSSPWGNIGYDTVHIHSHPNEGVANSRSGIFRRSTHPNQWTNSDLVIYTPDSFEPYGYELENPNTSMRVDEEFTLVGFVKIDADLDGENGAIIWLPTLPTSWTEDEPVTDPPPTAGVWYGADGLIHYLVGGQNGVDEEGKPVYGTVEATIEFPSIFAEQQGSSGNSASPVYRGEWDFFALTFKDGTVTGYYVWVDEEGNVIGWDDAVSQSTGEDEFKSALTSTDGVCTGGRILELDYDPSNSPPDKNPYSQSTFDMVFYGAMDQVGMYNYALTLQQLMALYYGTKEPSSIDYIREGWGIRSYISSN
jgi:hypothetical protein